ncbi:hypothetical protein AAFF_G00400070, partial [Aldrovandia affinis]
YRCVEYMAQRPLLTVPSSPLTSYQEAGMHPGPNMPRRDRQNYVPLNSYTHF